MERSFRKRHHWMIRYASVVGIYSVLGWGAAAAMAQTTTVEAESASSLAANPTVAESEMAPKPSLAQLLTSLVPVSDSTADPIADPMPDDPTASVTTATSDPLASASTAATVSTAVPASTAVSAHTPFQFTDTTVLPSAGDPMAPLVQSASLPASPVRGAAVPSVVDPMAPLSASTRSLSGQADTVTQTTTPESMLADAGALAPLAPPPAIESPAATPAAVNNAAPLLEDGPITPPSLNLQGSIIQIGDEFSARARLRGYAYLSSNVLVGATVDLTTGNAFSDTDGTGLGISELYIAAAPSGAPNLRFAVGQLDLTSYFDRNSFAKDSLTHFFNPVFQTNPALAATQLESQPAALVNWRATDDLILKAAAFSSGGIDDFSIDGFAGEVGVRFGDLILRGTYVSATDAGSRSSFPEIFQSNRGNGIFGTLPGDREVSYGVNAEWFIPTLNLGLFGRYGYQENQALDLSGQTYSGGVNLFDVFMADDRLGVGYGWGLSNDSLRQQQNGDTPDVFEVFYDVRVAPNIRAAVDFQQRNSFSETYLGIRVRADMELLNNTP
ncbi:MAG: carbohydrate porin [Cyanobacteria bacterium J06632_22]